MSLVFVRTEMVCLCFLIYLIEVYLICNVALISAVQFHLVQSFSHA